MSVGDGSVGAGAASGELWRTGSAVGAHLSGGVRLVVRQALVAHAVDARGYQRVVLRIPRR